jgi:glycosyltransferase involved in cell wall biosynthesis
MKPLVSVVMPVRNGGDYLSVAVKSILDQTHEQLELIVVDDHSTDDAIPMLDHPDPRLRLIPSQGRGVVAAFNTGFAHSKGEFIARMDGDDISLPQRLSCQLEYLACNPDIDIAGCRVEIFSEAGIQGGFKRYEEWLNSVCTPAQVHNQIFIESPMPNPGTLFRRNALESLDGYRDLSWPEDYDLFLRADAVGMQMGKPEPVLLRWREHNQRLTHNNAIYRREQFQAAKVHYLIHHRMNNQPVIIWGAGPTGRLTHDLIKAEGGQVDGFIEVHPRRIGGQKRGLPVWSMDKCKQAKLPMVLVAVGAAGARQEISAFMSEHNKAEGEDYLFVA